MKNENGRIGNGTNPNPGFSDFQENKMLILTKPVCGHKLYCPFKM
jgi:hypothetical protein